MEEYQNSTQEIIPLDNLIEQYSSESYLFHNKAIPIIRSCSGIISIISSVIFIWLIFYRSSSGLSTTQHRLLLGLCISDIIYSSTPSLFNIMAPNENTYYELTWNAMGNELTCDIQGFFVNLGFACASLYNCSLNLYYLAVVKYKWSDKYIRSKLEPYFHLVSILSSLITAIIVFINKNSNVDSSGMCWLAVHDPPHCNGYEDGEIREGFEIPCGRGRDKALIYTIMFIFGTITPVITIGASLFIIYRSVLKVEKRLSNYGVGTLRLSVIKATHEAPEESEPIESIPTFWYKVKNFMRCKFVTPQRRNETNEDRVDNIRSTSRRRKNSRAVMKKAVSYSIAYILTWIFVAIVFFSNVLGKTVPTFLLYCVAIFGNLQGLYNLIIYTHPKVVIIKNRNDLSWGEAIVKVFQTREGQHDTSTNTSNNASKLNREKSKCISSTPGPLSHHGENDDDSDNSEESDNMSL